MKKIFLLVFIFSTFLQGHKIAGMDLSVKKVDEDKIEIIGTNKKANLPLDGNKIKLLSMNNNKVLFEGFLKNGTLTTTIPNVPYFIYMYVGSQDVVIEGIAPKDGFQGVFASKKDRAFYYYLFFSLSFIFLTIIVILRKQFKLNFFQIK